VENAGVNPIEHQPTTLRYREVFCLAVLRHDVPVHANLSEQVRVAARVCPSYTVLGDHSRPLLHAYTVVALCSIVSVLSCVTDVGSVMLVLL